jgi:hypothetical protein
VSWQDPRGGGLRTAGRAARTVAHHEQAKSRRDESHGLRGQGSGRRWLLGAGAGAAVLALVVTVAVVAHGSSADPRPRVQAAAPIASASATPSSAPSASAEPAVVVTTAADTVPTGKFTVQSRTREWQRSGKALAPTSDSFRWTFKAASCTGDVCTGRVTSSRGARYDYTWDGQTLTMARSPVTTDRAPCVDDNGVLTQIDEASFIQTNTYTIGALTAEVVDGALASFGGTYSYTAEYQTFGTCKTTPRDTVRGRTSFTATAAG